MKLIERIKIAWRVIWSKSYICEQIKSAEDSAVAKFRDGVWRDFLNEMNYKALKRGMDQAFVSKHPSEPVVGFALFDYSSPWLDMATGQPHLIRSERYQRIMHKASVLTQRDVGTMLNRIQRELAIGLGEFLLEKDVIRWRTENAAGGGVYLIGELNYYEHINNGNNE